MSLDVWLTLKGAPKLEAPGTGIYVRVDGRTKEVSAEEFEQMYPGREAITVMEEMDDEDDGEVYHGNITHNLAPMASAANLYDCLWEPKEHHMGYAKLLIEPLRKGLHLLQAEPDRFRAYNPRNGWGDYEGLCAFVEEYLAACHRYPEAEVGTWR